MPRYSGVREQGAAPRGGQDIDSLLTRELRSVRKRQENQKFLLRLCCALAAVTMFTALVFRIAVIRGDSMAPALAQGDVALTWRLNHRYQQGDIVLFKASAADGVQVGRVVAVPGDEVRIDALSGEVMINGETLVESYVYGITQAADKAYPLILGEKEYFILGDNRMQAFDSRFSAIGAVPKKEIIGKLVLILRGC